MFCKMQIKMIFFCLLINLPIVFGWYIVPYDQSNIQANIEEVGVSLNLPQLGLRLVEKCNFNCSSDINLQTFDVETQWGILSSGIQDAWDSGYVGNELVSVCVIDTGLNSNKILKGGSFTNGSFSNDFEDYNGHGTFVSSVITTVSKNVTLLPCKFMDSTGSGMLSDMLSCMNFCAENEADIINCSFGTREYSEAFDIAMQSLTDLNIFTVAAAGNYNWDTDKIPVYPASISRFNMGILSVGALTQDGGKVSSSDYGKNTVQLGAPGENVLGIGPFGTIVPVTGTSVAAPFVSGAAVLMLSSRNEALNCTRIREVLVQTAKNGYMFPSVSVLDAIELYKT